MVPLTWQKLPRWTLLHSSRIATGPGAPPLCGPFCTCSLHLLPPGFSLLITGPGQMNICRVLCQISVYVTTRFTFLTARASVQAFTAGSHSSDWALCGREGWLPGAMFEGCCDYQTCISEQLLRSSLNFLKQECWLCWGVDFYGTENFSGVVTLLLLEPWQPGICF